MKNKKSLSLSLILSIAVHCIVAAMLLYFNFKTPQPKEDFVDIGFGNYGDENGTPSEGGVPGGGDDNQMPGKEVVSSPDVQQEQKTKVDLPDVKNTDRNEPSAGVKSDRDSKKHQAQKGSPMGTAAGTGTGGHGTGTGGTGSGSGNGGGKGFRLDFGGRGTRRVYSYHVPRYPEGANLESVDVRLKFTILPDGTVGSIIPLNKTDARFESISVNSLRHWRFEPLNSGNQIQSAIITFPYRLR